MKAWNLIVRSWSANVKSQKFNLVVFVCTCFILLWFPAKLVYRQTALNHRNREAGTTEIIKFLQKYKENTTSLCQCKRFASNTHETAFSFQSTCSDFSTQRGGDQKVVSYSYYNPNITDQKGSPNIQRYLEGLIGRANEVKMYYPGWIMRVYHNVSKDDAYGTEVLCNAFCNNDHIDLCDVTNLPVFGNKHEKNNGMFWRFLTLGDPTVKIFLSRDLDSVIQRRELDAVNEWLKRNETFHVMRDHPSHKAAILGGLWGAKNFQRREELMKVREKLLSSASVHTWGHDQSTLKKLVWPLAQTDILQHDSFNCNLKAHKNSIPFPTKRTIDVYVGWGPVGKENPLELFRKFTCPVNCRPAQHPDWEKC